MGVLHISKKEVDFNSHSEGVIVSDGTRVIFITNPNDCKHAAFTTMEVDTSYASPFKMYFVYAQGYNGRCKKYFINNIERKIEGIFKKIYIKDILGDTMMVIDIETEDYGLKPTIEILIK